MSSNESKWGRFEPNFYRIKDPLKDQFIKQHCYNFLRILDNQIIVNFYQIKVFLNKSIEARK